MSFYVQLSELNEFFEKNNTFWSEHFRHYVGPGQPWSYTKQHSIIKKITLERLETTEQRNNCVEARGI